MFLIPRRLFDPGEAASASVSNLQVLPAFVWFPQMPTIKLQSSDGEIFEVDVEIAKQSVTIKTMLEGRSPPPGPAGPTEPGFMQSFLVFYGFFLCPTDLGMDDDGDDDPVPLPNVNAAILKKVAQDTLVPTPCFYFGPCFCVTVPRQTGTACCPGPVVFTVVS